ncbi:hypothetical protein [Candidatus Minimicrobia vallesae]|nr:hypothetical protein [Candidatus Minimicrobia vallesae]
MKQLTKDPWLDEVEQFKPGEKVEGTSNPNYSIWCILGTVESSG